MPSRRELPKPLAELSMDELGVVLAAVETLIEFRDHLPPGGMLLVLVGRLRDDIRELLNMAALGRVSRGPGYKALDGLKDRDLSRLSRAIVVLYPEYADYIDDPEMVRLLAELFGQVTIKIAERATLEKVVALWTGGRQTQ